MAKGKITYFKDDGTNLRKSKKVTIRPCWGEYVPCLSINLKNKKDNNQELTISIDKLKKLIKASGY